MDTNALYMVQTSSIEDLGLAGTQAAADTGSNLSVVHLNGPYQSGPFLSSAAALGILESEGSKWY